MSQAKLNRVIGRLEIQKKKIQKIKMNNSSYIVIKKNKIDVQKKRTCKRRGNRKREENKNR